MSGNDSNYQQLITGSFTAISQNIDLTSPNSATEIVTISGTWVGTIIIEGSNEGSTYYTITTINKTTGLPVSDITANGSYLCGTNGFQFLRARSSSWTSGTGVINVYGSDSSSLNSNIDLLRGGTDGTLIGNIGNALKVTDTGTLPRLTGFTPGTQDIFGAVMTGQRTNQFEVDFSKGTVQSKLNIIFTGTATIPTLTNGRAEFSTGTGTSSLTRGTSFYSVVYKPGSEVYAEFTASFTTPTHANSLQNIGLFDDNNGFYIGYNGISFVAARRSATIDTVVTQASWNIDTLTGTSSSLFTRLGIPEAIDFTKINVFRIRFGWLGAATIFYEVMSPDGTWVTFHKVLFPNSSDSVSIENTELPIRLIISKTSADATDLKMKTACWSSGTSQVKTPGITPYGNLRITGWGTGIFKDYFQGSDLDYQNNWILPEVTGSASYNVTGSNLTLTTGTTVSSGIHLRSLNPIIRQTIGPVELKMGVQVATILTSNTHRFWGVGTHPPGGPTALLPLDDAIGFEIDTTGSLNAVLYANQVKIFSKPIIVISDGLFHDYVVLYNGSSIYWMVDSEDQALASCLHLNPYISDLPVHLHCLNHTIAPTIAPTLVFEYIGIANKNGDGQKTESHVLVDQYSSFTPDPGSHNTSEHTAQRVDSSGNLVARSLVLTDEGTFREDFSGTTLLTTLTGTIQLVNGNTFVIGNGTSFTSEILTGDYIKKVSDTEVFFSRVAEVTSDTRLILDEPFLGTTATGVTYSRSDWKTKTPTTGGGGMTLSNSIISMLPGTTSGSEVALYRHGDYLPYNLIFNAALSQRITNQTTILGFVDSDDVLGVKALFQFDGTDNTKIKCVSSFSNAAGDTQTTLITLANATTTDTYHTYEVDVTSQAVTFVIDGRVVAKNFLHVPSPYQVLLFEASVTNSATVTATTLSVDMVYFASLDRVQIANDFQGDPLKTSVMGISSITGLPIDLNLDENGNLLVSPIGGLGADFTFGDTSTSGTTLQAMRRTPYLEQSTNARMSFASSNVADSAFSGSARNTAITANDLSLIYPEIKALASTSYHAVAFGAGETLTPNVYDIVSAGSLTGTLHLDGGGNANALFVFKFTGAFTVSASAIITLTNGATPNNVFFISEAAISIAASCTLFGIYIAKIGAVTVGAGCNLTGKIASLSGSITTDEDNITSPTTLSVINLRTLITFSIFTSFGSITNTLGVISSLITGDIGTNNGVITGYNTGNSVVTGGIYTQASSNTTGTGALTLLLTYFTSTGAGPYLESVVLNGTTAVNTFSTSICYIEHIEVVTAGSSGANVGTITLYSGINKGGVVVGTIAPTDNQVFWAHHYVAVDKSCRIAGISGATDLTSSAYVLLSIRAKPIGVTDATELQVSDSFKLYGGASNAVRNYNSPITVTGPAKITMYAKPGSNSAQNVYGAFDFSES